MRKGGRGKGKRRAGGEKGKETRIERGEKRSREGGKRERRERIAGGRERGEKRMERGEKRDREGRKKGIKGKRNKEG